MNKVTRRTKDTSRLKMTAVAVVFGLIWAALWVRAGYIQIHQGEKLAEMARRQQTAQEMQKGSRGRILDRNGKVLATSVRVKSVYARPLEVEDVKSASRILSGVLNIPAKQISKRLSARKPFVWLARRVDDRAAAEIRKLDLPGIQLADGYGRIYPSERLAGQLVGFVGIDGHGLEGIERSYDEELSGQKASWSVAKDAAGRRLDFGGAATGLNGEDVRLTIDTEVQATAEKAIARTVEKYDAQSGIALVVKVDSGDILAWASYPWFNPNDYRNSGPAAWRNRPSLDVFEPGSTLKPFLIAAALEENKIQPDSLYFCENGKWQKYGLFIRDTHEYAWLPVNRVLRYSSNIGMAKIGLELGADVYHDYLVQLGFGDKTGLPFPGESRGLMRPPGAWNGFDLAAASFGQGIGVTAAQLAQAYLCLASGGVKKPLRLVLDSPGNTEPGVRIFSEQTADTVLSMMLEVVEMDGTGAPLRIDGLPMAAKTGTAQKASSEGGYGDKHVASFAALLPGDAPEYLVLCIVDEPTDNYYGSVVAGPVVREVGLKTMTYAGLFPRYNHLENSPVQLAKGKGSVRPVPVGAGAVNDTMFPDMRGMSLRSAASLLLKKGIVPSIKGQGTRIAKQAPRPGVAWPEPGAAQQTGKEAPIVTLWLGKNAES